VPCIIQVPAAVHSDSFDESFDHWVGAKGVHKFFILATIWSRALQLLPILILE
jgi:hypothetical protein